MNRRYSPMEVWAYIRGLPSAIEISMSSEGARIMQQVVDEWATEHGGREALDKTYFMSLGRSPDA